MRIDFGRRIFTWLAGLGFSGFLTWGMARALSDPEHLVEPNTPVVRAVGWVFLGLFLSGFVTLVVKTRWAFTRQILTIDESGIGEIPWSDLVGVAVVTAYNSSRYLQLEPKPGKRMDRLPIHVSQREAGPLRYQILLPGGRRRDYPAQIELTVMRYAPHLWRTDETAD